MKDLNVAIITGRFGKTPELRKTKNDKSFVDFSLAVNDGFGDEEHTSWIDCRAWNGVADIIGKYCDRGTKCTVQGPIKQDSWEDDDGKHTRTFIVVSEFYFAEKKKNDDDDGDAPREKKSTKRRSRDEDDEDEATRGKRSAGRRGRDEDEYDVRRSRSDDREDSRRSRSASKSSSKYTSYDGYDDDEF